MTPPEYGVWLILGAVTLLATVAIVFPVRGGHGQHAHAGPGTLTVDYLSATAFQPSPTPEPDDPDDDIVWPPEPTPLERNLARLCANPDGEYIGRHRLNEAYELYEPPPGWHLELHAA